MNLKFRTPDCELPGFLKSIRYNILVANTLFLLTGILLLLTGVTVLLIYMEYDGLITTTFFTMPSFVIATGSIMILGSTLGYYGAFSENFYCLAAYALLSIIILVFDVAMLIFAYGMQGNAARDIENTMWASMRQYGSRWEISMQWDELHAAFECCGVTGTNNWITNFIPVSCCHIDYGVVGTFECTAGNSYSAGCAGALGEWLDYNAHIVAVTASVATCIQVPITIVASYMAYRSKFHRVNLES